MWRLQLFRNRSADRLGQRLETALEGWVFAASRRVRPTLGTRVACGEGYARPNIPLLNKSSARFIPGNPRSNFLSSSMRGESETRQVSNGSRT